MVSKSLRSDEDFRRLHLRDCAAISTRDLEGDPVEDVLEFAFKLADKFTELFKMEEPSWDAVCYFTGPGSPFPSPNTC